MPDTLPHVVAPGEHLYDIAARYDVPAKDIWSLEDNQGLTSSGRTPAILAPGDIVMVPKKDPKFLPATVGATNTYVVTVNTVTVSFKLVDLDAKPIAGEPWEMDDPKKSGSSDGDGTIKILKVPMSLRILEVKLPKRQGLLRVKVGHLDPATTSSGQAQRLAHLGYLPSNGVVASDETIAWALERFASEEAPDAESADAVLQALVAAHGV